MIDRWLTNDANDANNINEQFDIIENAKKMEYENQTTFDKKIIFSMSTICLLKMKQDSNNF